MRKASIFVMIGFLFGGLTACAGHASLASPTNEANNPAPVIDATLAPTTLVSATVPTATPGKTTTLTPTLAPDAWESMPVVPKVNDTTRRIYANGLEFGNDPHALSIVGDCLSLPINLFGIYGKGPGHYNLGEYTYLQPVIDWFVDSFNRQSVTLGDGFNTAAVLSPLRADPKRCQPDETPLVCEYRIYHPSYSLISLGTDDNKISPELYEQRMRLIVEYTISQGIVPILSTKADDREGNNAFNRVVARLAYEYDIPLWNFWAAVQKLYKKGVANDRGWLTVGDGPSRLDLPDSMQYAIPIRNVTALQTLDSLWRGLTGS